MYICNEKHEEIVYQGFGCPLCDLMDTVNKLEDEIEDRGIDIETLKEKIEELEYIEETPKESK